MNLPVRSSRINSSRNALIIFTREPVPGATKTRLMPYYSPEQCAGLHRCILRDIRKGVRSADADIIIAYTGGRPRYLRRLFGIRTIFIEQRGSGLGERMENAIADAISIGYEKVILTGSDIPELEAETIDSALAMLDAHDVIIGPSADGGYYLIGMKQVHHEAFDVSLYGLSTVFEETVASMEKSGLKVGRVEEYADIDTPEDLMDYRDRMREDPHLRKSRTGRFVAANTSVSVIVPVYNESAEIEKMTAQLEPYQEDAEIIFVDGGSTDDTISKIGGTRNDNIPKIGGFKIIKSEKGRGPQLNAGALASSGDILFFLHCDSVLPADFLKEIRRCMASHSYGCFGVRFRSHNFFMLTNRVISNHRALFRGLPFGDQGVFIDRRLFFEMGMFPQIPIMEDYAFSRKMRRYGFRPGMTRKRIESSDRRYGNGTADIVRTEFEMWALRRSFRNGKDPEELAARYRDIR